MKANFEETFISSPDQFGKELLDNIRQGDEHQGTTLAQLKFLEDQGYKGGQFLKNLTNTKDETALNLAVMFHRDTDVMMKILKLCPSLIVHARKGNFEGQTALHIAISKQNSEAVEKMIKKGRTKKWMSQLLRTQATGSRFESTVMMGELPFSVAALTLDTDILEIMFRHDNHDMVKLQNSFGDTVFHSLIKYSSYHPDKTDEIIKILQYINQQLSQPSDQSKDPIESMALWSFRNNTNQTPLQLAALLEQVEIFNFILNLEDVYCRLDEHDGLFDVYLFDISEIDTVTIPGIQKSKPSKVAPSPVSHSKFPEKHINDYASRFQNWHVKQQMKNKPILETLCEINVEQAFKLLKINVMNKIIKHKWNRYRWIYFLWGFIHISYMTLLTVNAIFKTEHLKDMLQENATENPQSHGLKENFILGMNIWNIVVGVLIIVAEIFRCCQGHRFHLKQLHHNGSYRVLLLIFAVSLLLDSIWYLVVPSNNYFLIAALLIGWWFLTFFLRAFKKFSFFTVMLQKVLLGDAIRFAVIIIIELVSFTVAMHLTFLFTQPEGFEDIWETSLTLFNLMLGLTELSILGQARDPWLAILLFVVFVLVTYVIMFNALIAMMSQTCALVSENKVVQGELQRLSVILFIEHLLPNKLKVACGQKRHVKRFDRIQEKVINEERYFLEMNSLQTSYASGTAIVNLHNWLRTMKFDHHDLVKTNEFDDNVYEDNYFDKANKSSSQEFTSHELLFKPHAGGLSPVPLRNSLQRSSMRRKSKKERSAASQGSNSLTQVEEEIPHTSRQMNFPDLDDPPSRDTTDRLQTHPQISTME